MNVLALEPWYSGSHRHFLDGLAKHSQHTFRLATMPGRFWRWRMEGGGVTLARKVQDVLSDGFVPDVVLATDMVNLPAVLSLTRPRLNAVPVVLYFHENQLTYPLPPDRDRDRAYSVTNYLSALAADRVVFNSQFHFDEFTEALPLLLRDFPDFTNLHTVRSIRDKSTVLHLGMDLSAHDHYDASRTSQPLHSSPPVILWNHRWEYDKNPEAFFRVMNRLDDAGASFQLILAGKHFREQPEEFERAFERYAERILHYGYAEDFAEYSRLLHRADVVVSTALHEFFGVAMMEAVYCGCHPLLPNRLSYPELIPATHHKPLLHAPILYNEERDLFAILQDIVEGEQRTLPRATLRQIPEHLDWPQHVSAYDALLEETAEAHTVAA
jgi:glycosyltransferase involved in cell wall biosynthesis